MKKIKIYITVTFIAIVTLLACKEAKDKHGHDHDTEETSKKDAHKEEEEGHAHAEEELTLTKKQIDALEIQIETITKRNMGGFIQVNGRLGVPPQNEAVITSVLGANIYSINAIEGDKVSKGQTVAYISHPDIITMQTDYLRTFNTLTFLEQDYIRQKKLYEAEVGSGRDFQKAKSAFSSAKGLVKGMESQLELLGLSAKSIRSGTITKIAPIKSPIDGFVEKVLIKTGQYVQPHTPLFEVVNTEHIHADLMVFEKDISRVKNGQLVRFRVKALGNTELTATIYSVGKSFEEGPKALHIHAEIENKDKNLIPGMYVSAQIMTEEKLEQALLEDAVFQEGETFYIFTAAKKDKDTWAFLPTEIIVKSISNGYIAFDFKEPLPPNTLVAQSGAYYLMAEMKKGEAEHSH